MSKQTPIERSTIMFGWSLLAAYITVYDVFALLSGRRTLSTEYREASHRHPVVVGSVTIYLLVHLCGVLPQKFDPLRGLIGVVK